MASCAIMQPYLFPYLGYWQLINLVDNFVIYDDVSFQTKGFVNRNYINLNGKPYKLTLPLIKPSQNKLINEIEIGPRKKFLKTIKLNYSKKKQFSIIYPLLENILNQNENNLSKFIGYSISELKNFLGCTTNLLYSSELKIDIKKKGEDKIIEICKKINANTYLNPIGGKNLYNKNKFNQNDINLFFFETTIPKVLHSNNFNFSYFSVIDILMRKPKSEIINLLNKYYLHSS